MMRTILDTDIGTDVDDCLALALILSSPEIDLIGVTCVYGDVLLRARIAIKLLGLDGKDGIPVFAGASDPLLRLDNIYWGGHEGTAILTAEDETVQPQSQFAVDYIVETILDNPGEIHLLAIGPLTNVAMAIQKAPEITKKLAHLTIMGGVLRGYSDLSLPIAEHNIKCDPEAAHIVFTSDAPISLIPLNITVQTMLDLESVKRIRSGGSAFQDAVAHELETYPRIVQFGRTAPHDPLAVATMVNSSLVTTRKVTATVDISRQASRGAMHFQANPEGNIALVETVDSPAFKEFMLSRMEQPR